MALDYQAVSELARERSYESFTDLQELAFRTKDAYDYDRDLFVIGETSSGKTLIPVLLYAAAVKEAEARGEDCPKMLFVVPYRALAAQKTEEMQSFFAGMGMKIVQSTGEFRQDDDMIQDGQAHIAVIITEKIYKYESRDPSFLSKYDYIVLDEIGLIKDAERGIRLDFILAWAKNQKTLTNRPRIIALGTPFFDWSAYIDRYGFTAIKLGERPVRLEEVSVVYEKNGIESVEGKCSFLRRVRKIGKKEFDSMALKYEAPGSQCRHLEPEQDICPFETPCRMDPKLLCPVTNSPCPDQVEFVPDGTKVNEKSLLLQICREHLAAGQQVLVFVNDRTKVMEYCSFLYNHLKEYLPQAPEAEECKKLLLRDCGLESDDVFGILEYDADGQDRSEFYQAFLSGVGFHSAALPHELRTYVEKRFLDSRDMRIVCSTETLAFGVNSSVDVVIIAGLRKYDSGSARPLTMNEYQNYSGRAGRLRRHTNFSEINGYVYTLIKKKQLDLWNEMHANKSSPETLYSLFHLDQGRFMPFFLLNLLPTTSSSSVTLRELMRTVRILPQDGSVAENLLERKIQKGIRFLEQHELAVRVASMPGRRGQTEGTKAERRYCLTELGTRLRGHIIGCEDYEVLVKAVGEYVNGLFAEPDKTKFLFSLLCTKHAETGLNSIDPGLDTLAGTEQVRAYIRQHIAGEHDTEWLDTCENTKILFILAALIAWGEGESPRHLYRQYGIHYALLNKLAEQIAYLIEIAKEVLPTQMGAIYREKEAVYANMDITFEDYSEAIDKKLMQIGDLFVSVYYGVNTQIIQELLDHLRTESDDPVAAELIDELSLRRINPTSARKLRRIVIRYRFFDDPPKVDMDNIELRNNYLDQRRQYKKDVESFERPIYTFFQKKFATVFSV